MRNLCRQLERELTAACAEIERLEEECAKICETLPLDIDEKTWPNKTDQHLMRVAEVGCRNAFAAAIRARRTK